jgi:hypothetical protein
MQGRIVQGQIVWGQIVQGGIVSVCTLHGYPTYQFTHDTSPTLQMLAHRYSN